MNTLLSRLLQYGINAHYFIVQCFVIVLGFGIKTSIGRQARLRGCTVRGRTVQPGNE